MGKTEGRKIIEAMGLEDDKEWYYAGGNFEHHIKYHAQFCADWKIFIPDEPPTPDEPHWWRREEPTAWNRWIDTKDRSTCETPCPEPGTDETGPFTTCICGVEIKRWIYIFNVKTRQFEWIGCECRKLMEGKKICGLCKTETHKNTADNRCNTCRKNKKEKAKEQKASKCSDCGKRVGFNANGNRYRTCYACKAPRQYFSGY